jgi:hypothetical protein
MWNPELASCRKNQIAKITPLKIKQPEKTMGRLRGQSFPQTPTEAFRPFDLNSFAPVLRPVSASPAREAAAKNFPCEPSLTIE